MKHRYRTHVCVAFLLLLSLSGGLGLCGEVRLTEPDLQGKLHDPFSTDPAFKANLFVFLSADCPICAKYTPELRRLSQAWAGKGIRCWFVYPDPDTELKKLQVHSAECKFEGRFLLDRKQNLASRCRIQFTPEAALFSPSGELVYHGRIDDRFPALGVERPVSERTLELAIDHFLAGRTNLIRSVPGVGCQLPTLP